MKLNTLSAATPRPLPTAPKPWTVLMYNAGEADEGLMSTHNLLDLQTVGSDENTHVVCMNYRSPWIYERFLGIGKESLGTHSYYLERRPDNRKPAALAAFPEMQHFAGFLRSTPGKITSPTIDNSQNADKPGEASALKAFLVDNMKRYPAQHFALIMSGHGAGFAGQSVVGGSRIKNEELGQLLREVAQEVGRPIDVLNLNTCYSAGLEVLHPLQGGANVVVASESTVNAANQSFAPTLEALQNSLKAGQSVSPEELGKLFVEESRFQPLSNLYTPSLSAFKLEGIGPLADTLGQLHQRLMDLKVPPEQLREALQQTQQLPYASVPRAVPIFDLGSFVRKLPQFCDDERVAELCHQLQEQLQSALLAEQHATAEKETPTTRALRPFLGKPSGDLSGLSGLSIYYETLLHKPGHRLAQVKDTALGKQLQIETFSQYLSQTEVQQPSRLEQLSTRVRQAELKLHKSIGIPYVVPVAKWGLKAAAFLGASAALSYLGVPVSEMLLGPWFAGSGFWGAARNVHEALTIARQPGERSIEQREKLVDCAAQATLGATMGTFGLHMMGLLPASVVWPVVGVALAARLGKVAGKALSNRSELAQHRQQAERFARAETVADRLRVAAS